MMKLSPDVRAVYVKAGKTFVQTMLPSMAYLYSHAHTWQTAYPVLASGAIAGGAAAGAVVWNGALTAKQRSQARKLMQLADYVDQQVKHALASQGPTPEVPAA